MIGRSRLAVSGIFLVNGIGIGVFAAFVPIFKERLALNDAAVAIVLFCAAVGAIVAMPLCGAFVDRYGSARIVAASGTLFGIALGCATAAPTFVLAALAALVMGAGNGAMDVAMNVNGVTLQTQSGRPIMSSLHGLFSVGTFVAAGGIAALLAGQLPPGVASIAVTLLVTVTSLLCRPLLVREPAVIRGLAGRRAPLHIPGRLIMLGIAAICGAVSEGALVEWSALYTRESLHVGISAALGAFAAYSIAMSTSRFCGDAIVARIGPVTLVRASGLLGATGLALALILHTYVAVLSGFFIVGIGLGNVSPLVYGAGADATRTGAGAGVAVVTTLGYGGFLIGPALIGFTAQRASIDTAFWLIALFSVGIALLAPVLKRR